jgi:transcriptional regulator with XRE-family HTH domain
MKQLKITDFGQKIRDARFKARVSLRDMSKSLDVTPAFLSSIETGRSKIPLDIVGRIARFLSENKCPVDERELRKLAMVANENAPLSNLPPLHQMLVAGFASSDFSSKQLEKLAKVLASIHGGGGEK